MRASSIIAPAVAHHRSRRRGLAGAAAGSGALDSTGHASYAASSLAGNHTVVATCSDDKNHAPSSASLPETIVGAPATFAVVCGSGQPGYTDSAVVSATYTIR